MLEKMLETLKQLVIDEIIFIDKGYDEKDRPVEIQEQYETLQGILRWIEEQAVKEFVL